MGIPLRTVVVVAYARAHERAERRHLKDTQKVIVSRDRIEVEVHNTNSSFEDCRHGSCGGGEGA